MTSLERRANTFGGAHHTKKLTKVHFKDTNSLVADSPKRPDDAAWDDLDQAFFASAPPDVPELPAEPERFDDLFPAAPPEPPRTRNTPIALRRASAAAASTGASLQRALQNVGRRTGPAVASAGRQAARLTTTAWRRSARALGAAGAATLRTVRPAAARVVGALRVRRPSGQAIAIALASVILVTGISAVVVASRSSAPANLPATPLMSRASAAGTTVASTMPAPAQVPAPPFPPDPEPPATPAAQSSPSLPDPEPPTAQPDLPDPEPPARMHSSGDSRHRRAELAKRPAAPAVAAPASSHKHRRAAYSADKDLMVPSFMQQAPQPASPARQPAPTPAQRPLFAR
jgi:hypothetical protein